MPIGSIAGGLIGQAGAQQGGQMAYNAAMGGAMTAQNIANDQRKINRMDLSPYTATGRTSLDLIGQLLGWGTLESGGGDDPWRWNPNAGGKSSAKWQESARTKINALADSVPRPTFNELKVSENFQADPGYQFRLTEGMKALDRSAASRGKLLSGEQVKGATDFNSGLASQEYGNWWNRYTGATQFNNAARQQDYTNRYGAYANVLNLLTGLAGQGQSAATGMASMNTGLTNNVANAFTSAGISGGQALGAGYAQGANALASGIGSGINNAITLGWMGFNPRSGWFTSGGGRSGYTGRVQGMGGDYGANI